MRAESVRPTHMEDERCEAPDVRRITEKAFSRWENEGGAVGYELPDCPDPGESAFDESR